MVRAYQAYVNFSYEKTDGFDEYFYSDEITDDKIKITSTICGKTTVEEYDLQGDFLNKKKFARRFGKRSIYKTLKEYSGEWLPYGCLTGVRPTKLYAELLREGIDAKGEFTGFFDVTPEKAEHVARIVKKSGKAPENRKRRSRRVCEYPVLSDTMCLLQFCCGFDEATQKIP